MFGSWRLGSSALRVPAVPAVAGVCTAVSATSVCQALSGCVASARREASTEAAATAAASSDIARESARIRNVAIIAHVDHGKTSLTDCLLAEAGSNVQINARAMDSHALEKERGITIMSKATSVPWKDHQINILDTPGHADFGGEVERVLSMVDGVALVVDATEGPMTQTKFVLSKALKANLRPFVVINKVDRETARVKDVDGEIFEMFDALGATDEQMEYTTLFASAKDGWATADIDDTERGKDRTGQGVSVILDAILNDVPPPVVDADAPFRMLVNAIDRHEFFGRTLLGRIASGRLSTGDEVAVLSPDGERVEKTRILKMFKHHGGVGQDIVESAVAGDIVSVAGLVKAHVASTLVDPLVEGLGPIPSTKVDPPTVAIEVSPNTSGLAGRDGSKLTSNAIKERLQMEAGSNVSLALVERGKSESFELHGRGELQLSVILEGMRRDGFELSVSPPRVLFQKDEEGKTLEPMEEVVIDVDTEFTGTVIDKLTLRKGELVSFDNSVIDDNKSRIVFRCTSRGLLGFRQEFINDTRGTGILNHSFCGYEPYAGEIGTSRKGALIASTPGTTTSYALAALEPRGELFVAPSEEVYTGMVVGEHSRDSDLEVNCVKAKQLTNIRASGKDDAIRLAPPRSMSLEALIAYCKDDELVEVTPTALRLRKRVLDPTARKAEARKGKKSLGDA